MPMSTEQGDQGEGIRGGSIEGGEGTGKRGSGYSILIRHLNYSTNEEDLRAVYQKFGEILDIYIPNEYYTGKKRGFAFVEFVDTKGQDEAVEETDGIEIDGYSVSVCKAERRRKTPQHYRQNSRGGGRDRYRDYDDRRGGGGYRRSPDRGRGRDSSYDRYHRDRDRPRYRDSVSPGRHRRRDPSYRGDSYRGEKRKSIDRDRYSPEDYRRSRRHELY